MASFGLLGAIGGLGQAMQTVGQDMEKRRQQALVWAAEEAKRMRERAEKRADEQEKRTYTEGREEVKETWQRERIGINQDRQDQRQDKSISAADKRQGVQIAATDRRQEDAQSHAQAMARLQDSLASSRAAQNEDQRQRNRIALDKLNEGKPKGIIWADDPDAPGKQRAFKWWDDGRTESTNFTRTPRARDDEGTPNRFQRR